MQNMKKFEETRAGFDKVLKPIRYMRARKRGVLRQVFVGPLLLATEWIALGAMAVLTFGIVLPIVVIWNALKHAPREVAKSPRLFVAIAAAVLVFAAATVLWGAKPVLLGLGIAFLGLYLVPLAVMALSGRGGTNMPGKGGVLMTYMVLVFPMIAIALVGTGVGAAIAPILP